MLSEREILDLLGPNPHNADHLRDLTVQLATSSGILPFVGAGMSVPFGFPQWGEFLLKVAAAAVVDMTGQVKSRLDASPPQYEEAAADVLNALGARKFQDLLAAQFGDRAIAGKRLAGAVTELVKFPCGPIVTTNFDGVLEAVFQQANITLKVCSHSEAARGFEALQQRQPFLLKLHGSWDEPDSRILTLDEYQKAYGGDTGEQIVFGPSIPGLLFTILSGRCCLFLGCSLHQDRMVQRLKAIAHGIKTLVHYAIVEQPAKPEEFAVRAAELSGQGIRPIWYPHGGHDLIQPLLSYLAVKAVDGLRVFVSKEVARAAGAGGVRNNIPDPGNATVGRKAEVVQVSQMLAAARCVTITGPGGCGKSRLAIEVATAVKEQYQDGVWFVPLADLAKKADTERVLAARIGRIIGVPEQAGRPPHEALAEHLAAGRYLIVLDNCEHLVKSCTEVTGYLLKECPSLTILTTSRRPLKIRQERLYPLAPLKAPDPDVTKLDEIRTNESVMLFVARAAERSPGYLLDNSNALAVAALCRALDGIPLAIEVAAARLGVKSVEEMSRESSDLLSTIGNIGSGDLRRWKTLTAALRWSYGLLDRHQQAFMRSLAVFDGGWTAKAAEAVYARPASDSTPVLDYLQALYESSLVVGYDAGGARRFRFLEPIRQLAHMQLEPAERAECGRRHAEFFLQLAEQAAPELLKSQQADWLDMLQLEVDNFRAASRWAVATANAGLGLRLFAALWRFMEIRGGLTEGRARAEDALRIPGAENLREVRSKALSGAGMLAYRQADFDAAERMFAESLEIEEQLQSDRGIANALNDLGNIANRKRQYDRARELYTRSLELERKTGNRRGVAVANFNLGDTAIYTGEYEEARRLLEESVREFEEGGNPRDSAFPLNGLAQAAIAVGNLELAEEYAARSLAIRRQVKDAKGIGDTLRTLGWASIEGKDFACAQERLSRSVSFTRGVDDRRGISEALDLFALLYSDRGQAGRAIGLFAAAAQLRGNLEYAPRVRVMRRMSALAAAREVVGEQEYAAEWRRGGAQTMATAIEGALQDAGAHPAG